MPQTKQFPKPRRQIIYAGNTGTSGELLMDTVTVPKMIDGGVVVGLGTSEFTDHVAKAAWLSDSSSRGTPPNQEPPGPSNANVTAALNSITSRINIGTLSDDSLVVLNIEGGYVTRITDAVYRGDTSEVSSVVSVMQTICDNVRAVYPNIVLSNFGTPPPPYRVPNLATGESNQFEWQDIETQDSNQEEFVERHVEIFQSAVSVFDIMSVRIYPQIGKEDPNNPGRLREDRYVRGSMEIAKRLKAITGKKIMVTIQPLWRGGWQGGGSGYNWDNPFPGEYPRDSWITDDIWKSQYIDKIFDLGADAIHIWTSAGYAYRSFNGSGTDSSVRNDRNLVKYNLLTPRGVDPGDVSQDTWWQDSTNREETFRYGRDILAKRAIDTAMMSLKADMRNAARQSTLFSNINL
jgi:hypothetical protein